MYVLSAPPTSNYSDSPIPIPNHQIASGYRTSRGVPPQKDAYDARHPSLGILSTPPQSRGFYHSIIPTQLVSTTLSPSIPLLSTTPSKYFRGLRRRIEPDSALERPAPARSTRESVIHSLVRAVEVRISILAFETTGMVPCPTLRLVYRQTYTPSTSISTSKIHRDARYRQQQSRTSLYSSGRTLLKGVCSIFISYAVADSSSS